MNRRAVVGRAAAVTKRPAAPRSPKAASVGPSGVTLRWLAPKGVKVAHYVVLRDGKVLAKTKHLSYTDHKVKQGKTYRYAVRAVDRKGRSGKLSRALRVLIPVTPKTTLPAPPASAGPTPAIAPIGPPAPAPAADTTPILTQAMVDRLFWRAGFGPSAADRATWTGRHADELVDWMLSTTPAIADTTTPPPLNSSNGPIDPQVSDDELITDWLNTMQRVDNPLPERLTFFWHRHWAVSRDDGIPYLFLTKYVTLLRSYAMFSANPDATFWQMAYDVSTACGAMSWYLDGNTNGKKAPNENYAREFMELFTLGPTGPDGTPNYTQTDVTELARAFTGWRYNNTSSQVEYGDVSFNPASFDGGAKTVIGQTIAAAPNPTRPVAADGPACVRRAVDIILAHPNHPQFLIRKLWAEFIAAPIPADTLAALTADYLASGTRLKPLIRSILLHPLIFESIDEPNLVKPPVVYLVGILRALKCPIKVASLTSGGGALGNMQQRPYFPPNVAGWEGGLSWLNSNTVQARFNAVAQVQALLYGTTYSASNQAPVIPADSSVAEAYDRAWQSVGSPWVSEQTRDSIIAFATASLPVNSTNPTTLANQLRQRFYTMQALILGGPDGQVM